MSNDPISSLTLIAFLQGVKHLLEAVLVMLYGVKNGVQTLYAREHFGMFRAVDAKYYYTAYYLFQIKVINMFCPISTDLQWAWDVKRQIRFT